MAGAAAPAQLLFDTLLASLQVGGGRRDAVMNLNLNLDDGLQRSAHPPAHPAPGWLSFILGVLR